MNTNTQSNETPIQTQKKSVQTNNFAEKAVAISFGVALLAASWDWKTHHDRFLALKTVGDGLKNQYSLTGKKFDEGVVGACQGTADRIMLVAEQNNDHYRLSCGNDYYEFKVK